MAILTVGPGEEYSTLTAAVAAAQNGDTIQVQAGTYTNDFPETITQSITIEGVGGMANFVATESPPNGKGILVIGNASSAPDVTLINLGFSGASISEAEGGDAAGVRYQSGNLTIDDSDFHDNQDGLLATPETAGTGSVVINDSEFANNGTTNGLTHNIYVTNVGTFDISNSYITAANTGNEIQSRALVNNITDNRIVDGSTATASYSINLPNGGVDVVSGNTIEQGPNSGNPDVIGFGESTVYAGSSLSVSNNTIVNDYNHADALAIYNLSSVVPTFTDNSVYGLTSSQISNEPVVDVQTTYLTTEPAISDAPPYDVCFCAGTMIATPHGEVPIERLVVGDRVLTRTGVARMITWIGVGRVLAVANRRSAATPVIVRQGALADGIPHRDLHVTRAHGLYIDDVLIPVEFLINHRSILWDDQSQEVRIYHIEMESHDVVIANGAPAETYRDDGNRWLFQNADSRWNQTTQPPCAPVMTGGEIVDRVWSRLLQRAGGPRGVRTTDDPDLHLLVDGVRVDGKAFPRQIYAFHLPHPPGTVQVVSRAVVPAELGFARDPRRLGVALRRIAVWQGTRLRLVEASDDEALVQGFHLFEAADGFRWTDGSATLPAALFAALNGPCDLELHVGCTTHYPAPEARASQIAA